MLMVNKTDSYMDFNCTSTGSPATDVMWLRNDVIIQAVTQQIIRDRHSSTYENLIRIPISELSTGRYSCNVSNVIGWDEDHTEISKQKGLYNVLAIDLTCNISLQLLHYSCR